MNSKSVILKDLSRGGFCVVTDEELEGSYLYYFKDVCMFVRSGNAVGSNNSCPVSGIVQRNENGHKKKAALSSLADGECFYTLFPAVSNPHQLPNKWGHFEDLVLYSGFCFNRKKNTGELTSVEEG